MVWSVRSDPVRFGSLQETSMCRYISIYIVIYLWMGSKRPRQDTAQLPPPRFNLFLIVHIIVSAFLRVVPTHTQPTGITTRPAPPSPSPSAAKSSGRGMARSRKSPRDRPATTGSRAVPTICTWSTATMGGAVYFSKGPSMPVWWIMRRRPRQAGRGGGPRRVQVPVPVPVPTKAQTAVAVPARRRDPHRPADRSRGPSRAGSPGREVLPPRRQEKLAGQPPPLYRYRDRPWRPSRPPGATAPEG